LDRTLRKTPNPKPYTFVQTLHKKEKLSMHLNMDPEAEFGLSESSSEEVRLPTNILSLIRARLKDHTHEVASIRRACCAKSYQSMLFCIAFDNRKVGER